jgi:hypothetical protein
MNEALVERAEREKLAPLLGARLAAGTLTATPDAATLLQAAYRESVAREMTAEAALAPLLVALRQRGVEALAVKGLALRHTVYGSGERWMADVDLLLRPGDWRHLRGALQTVAARVVHSGERPVTDRLFHEIHAVLPPGFLVDLHRALHSWPLFPIDTGDLFDRSWSLPRRDDGLRLPAVEDQLVVLATHAAKDGHFVPLRDVVDSLLLLRHSAPMEGPEALRERLVDRACRWRCRKAVALWLRVLLRFGLDPEPWRRAVETLDARGRTVARAAALPQRFRGTPRRHAWTVKGRLAALQDAPWRGATFLAVGGALYGIDAILRCLTPTRPAATAQSR